MKAEAFVLITFALHSFDINIMLLADELQLKGHDVSHDTVRHLLKDGGYSLQTPKKHINNYKIFYIIISSGQRMM